MTLKKTLPHYHEARTVCFILQSAYTLSIKTTCVCISHILCVAIMHSGLPNVCCMKLMRTGEPRSWQTEGGRGGQIIKEKRKGSRAYCKLKMKIHMWVRKWDEKGFANESNRVE